MTDTERPVWTEVWTEVVLLILVFGFGYFWGWITANATADLKQMREANAAYEETLAK